MTLMPIGRFSKSCRLSIKALRHYDQLGLLRPAHVDETTGYRYYDASQARMAVMIAMLRSLDVPLSVIQRLLESSDDEISAILRDEEARLAQELAQKKLALDSIGRLARAGTLLPYDVQLRHEPPRRMAQMSVPTDWNRHVEDASIIVQALFAALEAAGVAIESPIMGRVAFSTTNEDLRVDMMAPVPDGVDTVAGGTIVDLPESTVAWTLHRGAYEELGLAYHALHAWAQERGHETCRDVLEVYLNDPEKVETEQLLTEVLLPVDG